MKPTRATYRYSRALASAAILTQIATPTNAQLSWQVNPKGTPPDSSLLHWEFNQEQEGNKWDSSSNPHFLEWTSLSTTSPSQWRSLQWEAITTTPHKTWRLERTPWEKGQEPDNRINQRTISWHSIPPISEKTTSNTNTSQQQIPEQLSRPSPRIAFTPFTTKKSANQLVWTYVQEGEEVPPPDLASRQSPATLNDAKRLAHELSFRGKAYSRGSLIQIGDVQYPNLGFNALQRQPDSWVSLGISAIGTSRQSSACRTTATKLDFFDDCADALFESYWRILNGENYSFDLQWTVHSLSGAGSPLPIAGRTGGTDFGEGQSLGFKLASNLNETLGFTFGANRLIHLDETTDLPKNLYLMGTKVFMLNKSETPPIISVSLGLMSDVYNPNTSLGTMQYPQWLLGGQYPSLFGQAFDPKAPNRARGYYPNVAGVTSAYVCADQSIYAGKPLSAADPNCIKQVAIGPVASVGFAPWPWIGVYAKYTANITLALSLKPFSQIPWTFSFEAIAPINGINPIQDRSLRRFDCNGEEPTSFSACRTRYGIFTQLNF